MDFIEVTGKTVEDAITEACRKLTVTSDHLEYEVIDKGNTGFLGFNSKPAWRSGLRSRESERRTR